MNQNYKNRSLYVNRACAVKNYSYSENINSKYRDSMEDDYFVIDNFDNKNQILFGIFDGHGGSFCVQKVKIQFYKIFNDQLKNDSKDIKKCFQNTFLILDKSLECQESQYCGTTACVGFLRYENSKKVLYIGNIGDTRAVISNDVQSERISYDHKASDRKEQDRVKFKYFFYLKFYLCVLPMLIDRQKGGYITNNRVEGILAITRSFGDFILKHKGVIASPYVNRIELRIINKYLILGSDGLWDVVNDHEICQMIQYENDSKDISEKLLKIAEDRQSQDNISILAIRIN